jgi:hypothetical protein
MKVRFRNSTFLWEVVCSMVMDCCCDCFRENGAKTGLRRRNVVPDPLKSIQRHQPNLESIFFCTYHPSMANIWEQIDEKLLEVVSAWNLATVVLIVLIVGVGAYSIFTLQDPDIHPMILQRQAYASQVRHKGESAVYRSPETPEGVSLKTGLNTRIPTDPPYSGGRDGDLRYIWKAITGEWPRNATEKSPKKQEIRTVYGKEQIETHDLQALNKEIILIGEHLHRHGSKRVAIYLPNSIEFLSTVFAGAFYGLNVILIPYNLPHPTIVSILRSTGADSLIAGAGSIPLDILTKGHSSVKQVVWTVEKSSRHMDWTDVPEGLGGSIDVAVWHELLDEHKTEALPELPILEPSQLGNVITIWDKEMLQSGAKSPVNEIFEFTQANFIAAIASLISALPSRERYSSKDTFLCADAFTNSYSLCQVFAGLYAGSSLIISSVAGPQVDLTFVAKQIAPTVVIASAESVSELHSAASTTVASGLAKWSHSLQLSSFDSGVMPSSGIISSKTAKTFIGTSPGTLRLLLIGEKAKTSNPPLSSADICDLRVFTGARILYALTAAQVAGAVAQTHVYDYRRKASPSHKHSHFGTPLSCLEIKLVDVADTKTTDESVEGHVSTIELPLKKTLIRP